MIIDHIGLAVGDYDRSKAFFSQALAPLGIALTPARARLVRKTLEQRVGYELA